MKTIFQHIDHIKTKPHHVRKRVAFAAATGVAAFIAVVWLSVSLGTGVFAIQGSSFADSTGAGNSLAATAPDNSQALAGAAAALPADDKAAASAPAHIEIIDTAPAPKQKAQPTIIPF